MICHHFAFTMLRTPICQKCGTTALLAYWCMVVTTCGPRNASLPSQWCPQSSRKSYPSRVVWGPPNIDARRIFEKCKKVTRDVTFRSFISSSVCASGPWAINVFLFFSIIEDYAFTIASRPCGKFTCLDVCSFLRIRMCATFVHCFHLVSFIDKGLSWWKLINSVKFLTLSIYR